MGNISRELHAHLPPGVVELLKDVGVTARAEGSAAYLVGGVVRDLLLERTNLDLDVVVEGDAVALAKEIAAAKNWAARTHPRFGTAKLSSDSISVDMVMARSEVYVRPGALPTVRPGSILDDLLRRDFTINAMAAKLDPQSFGELLDPHGGSDDLRNRIIRVLHAASFVDDPTRILRALRYEQRLDFRLEENTERLVREGVNNLATVTAERLWHEMELILKEARPEKVLCRAGELGVLSHLCPALAADDWLSERFRQARDSAEDPSSVVGTYLALWAYRLTEADAMDCIGRLKMPGWAARAINEVQRLKRSLKPLADPASRSNQIYHALQGFPPDVVTAVALASDSSLVRRRLELYLRELQHVSISLDGRSLQAMGVPAGRKMGQILRALHDARLDGEVSSLEDEKELVRRLLRR